MTLRRAAGLTLLGFVFSLGTEVSTQGTSDVHALEHRVKALEEQLRKLEQQLRELQRASAAKPPPPATQPQSAQGPVLQIGGAPFKGEPDAPITIVEFSDYECSFCGRHVRDTLPLIERDYIRTGKVKYVFRSFPVEARHKFAFKAHEAAACAGDQGKYWEMHDRLFARQAALAPDQLPEHAATVNLDIAAFRRCLESGKHAAAVREDLAHGRAAGVSGTPNFYIGLTGRPGATTVTTVHTIRGAKNFQVFKEAIDKLLARP